MTLDETERKALDWFLMMKIYMYENQHRLSKAELQLLHQQQRELFQISQRPAKRLIEATRRL